MRSCLLIPGFYPARSSAVLTSGWSWIPGFFEREMRVCAGKKAYLGPGAESLKSKETITLSPPSSENEIIATTWPSALMPQNVHKHSNKWEVLADAGLGADGNCSPQEWPRSCGIGKNSRNKCPGGWGTRRMQKAQGNYKERDAFTYHRNFPFQPWVKKFHRNLSMFQQCVACVRFKSSCGWRV